MGVPCQILPFYVGKFHSRLLRKKKLSRVLYIQEQVGLSPYVVISQGWRLPEEKVGPAGKEQAVSDIMGSCAAGIRASDSVA